MSDYYEDLYWDEDGMDLDEAYLDDQETPYDGFTGNTGNRSGGKFLPCAYCKAYPLKWGKHETGWRLFHQDGKLHSCDKYKRKEL